MDTLGEYLKEWRKGKNVPLEEIASRTRINIVYLEALESDDFNKLPGEAIARGFVLSYAKCIGMNEKETLLMFDRMGRPFFQRRDESRRDSPMQTNLMRPREIRTKRLGKIGVLIIVGLIFGFMYFLGQDRVREDRFSLNPVPIEDTASMESLPEPPVIIEESSVISQEADTEPVASEKEVVGIQKVGRLELDPFQITIEAIETAWVSADIDEDEFREVLLRPGDTVTWNAKEQFNLSLGNAGGVKVKLNGELLGPFGPTGVVVRDIILTRGHQE